MAQKDNKQHYDDILRRLEDSSVAAQLELEKAMHVAGSLADFFDLRDEAQSNYCTQKTIVCGYKSAAIDNDIVQDYISRASQQVQDIVNWVKMLNE